MAILDEIACAEIHSQAQQAFVCLGSVIKEAGLEDNNNNNNEFI